MAETFGQQMGNNVNPNGKFSKQIVQKEQRPSRTQRVFQRQQIVKQTFEIARQRDLENRYNKKKEELSNVTYEEYFSKYEELPNDLKPYFSSPDEIKLTAEYQDYATKKAEYERQKKEYDDYHYGYKMGLKMKVDPDFNETMRQGYIDARNQLENYEIQKQYEQALQKWKDANPSEKLITDKSGKVIGVESGIFQKSMTIEEYNKLASRTPDQIYTDWKNETATKPIYLDFTSSDVVLPYEKRGTINLNATPTKLYPVYVAKITTTPTTNIFKKSWEGIKTFIEGTPELQFPLIQSPIIPRITPIINITDLTDPLMKHIEEKEQETYEKMISETPNKEKIDTKFQQEYQTRFEDVYMKKIIYGEIDFETASSEFEKSDTAKIISKKYGTEITEDTKKMELLDKWKYGSEIFGLETAKKITDFIPINYGELVVKGAMVYAGVKVLSYIPPLVNKALLGGSFIQGTYKAFSKKSTPIEAGTGLITAGISGGLLAYEGIRYLKSPVIKTKSISPKQINLEASGTVGKDIKIITDSETINKVLYQEQKLAQVVKMGRRTIVTTKWRDLLNKYLGTNIPNIYEGIPYQQGAIYGTDVFRGTKYKITLSGYEQAKNLLEKYGYTSSQATRTLRYYAPEITEQWLKRGIINIKDDFSASGRFVYEIRKPIIELDNTLGIKTRGGKTITEVYDIERKIIELNDKQLMLELRTKVSGYLSRGIVKIKDFGFSKSLSAVKVSDLRKGYEQLKKFEGINIYRNPALYKDIYSISREGFSILVTPKQKRTVIDVIIRNTRKSTLKKTILFDKEIDLTSKYGITTIQKGNIEKIIEKATEQKSIIGTTKVVQNKQITQLTEQLKADVIIDPIQETKIIPISKVNVDQLTRLKVGLAVAGASAIKLDQGLKSETQLKSQLREMQIQKLDQGLSQLLKSDLKFKQAQRTNSMLLSLNASLNLTTITPILKIPTIKTPTKTNPIIFFFGGDELKKKIKSKIKKKKEFEELALLPDFTARAIGLEPQQFSSVKDALREINRIKTGFEVQRGGQFKVGNIKTGFATPKKFVIRGSNVRKLGDMDIDLKGIMA